MFELFTEDVVKSNSFVLFHHFDVKLEFTRGERSSEVMVVLATFTIKLKPMHLLYISHVVITSSITGWYHVTVTAVVSWEKWVAQLTLPSPTHCNICIKIIKIVYVD